jgi:hypothetical protein
MMKSLPQRVLVTEGGTMSFSKPGYLVSLCQLCAFFLYFTRAEGDAVVIKVHAITN